MGKRIRNPGYKPKLGTLYRAYLDIYPKDGQVEWHQYLHNLFELWRHHVLWTSNCLVINEYGHLYSTNCDLHTVEVERRGNVPKA